jgi:hypothetical protein
MELTKEQKRLLLITSMHLKSYGKKMGQFQIEDLQGDVDSWQDHFYEIGRSEIKCPIPENFKDFCFEIYENYISSEVDSENRATTTFTIDTEKKIFDIEITEYEWDSEEYGNSFSLDDVEDDENVMKAINLMKENKIESLVVSYDGSGDSGGIESWDQTPNNPNIKGELGGLLEDWVYNTLENYHGGWEINEGSSGHFTFYPNDYDNTVDLNHYMNVEREDTRQFLETNF